MYCDIAKNLDRDQLDRIEALERELDLTVVAFACRSLDPAREERLRRAMEELGPVLQAPLAEPEEPQLRRIRETEDALGLALVAVRR
jgi:hypothetical protein